MQITDGSCRVSVSYSLKVPGPNYSSESVNLSVSMEFPAEGDTEQIAAQARAEEQKMFRDLQLSAFTYLGVEDFTELPNGRLIPTIPTFEKPKKSGGGGGSYGGGNRSGGGGGYGKPKADPSSIPSHNIDLNGNQVTVQDLRGLKADGTYKQTAPDFRKGDQPIWINAKGGGVNPEGQAIADAIDAKAAAEAPW